MKFLFLFIAAVTTVTGFAQEIEIVPCKKNLSLDLVPTCCLKRVDSQLILFQGEQEIKRFSISRGTNLVETDHSADVSLLIALQTLEAMRRLGACK